MISAHNDKQSRHAMPSLRWRTLASALLIAGALVGTSRSWASIRVDGSQFQATSGVVRTTSFKTSGLQDPSQSHQPKFVMMTFGQAVMAQGSMPDSGGNGVAFRIGLGYEYNVWQTALELGCGCACHSDPVCDGVWNVLDIVQAINVAFRGQLGDTGENCPNALTDVNCDGKTDLMDVIALVDVAFRLAPAGQVLCAPCAE